ncbi:MAG: glutathione S-transferase [Rhizobacter sp.]|nr:glutathione S-transferase [Rhizobacter sp.]
MNDLILHHYQNSPFSEKVRLVFGLKGLSWKSVHTPIMMPKPDVVALTGGYRKAPFLQIGADIYCDTALMCRVIDRLAPEPPLYPPPVSGQANLLAEWADSTLFWKAVPFTLQPQSIPYVFPGATPDTMKAFSADRAVFSAGVRRSSVVDATEQLHTWFGWLEHMLGDGQPFLLSSLPSIADFSVYHALWFMHLSPPIAQILSPYGQLLRWYERMTAFGHGRSEKMTSEEAIAVARGCTDRASLTFTAAPGLVEGMRVTVTPTDVGMDPVEGELVGLTHEEVVISRIDERAGSVNVHFPRIGFQVKKVG